MLPNIITPSQPLILPYDISSIRNLVSNGDFSGTTGWTFVSGIGSVGSNTYYLTGDGAGAGVALIQATSIALGINKRYYMRLRVRVTNASCSNITLQYDGSTAGTNKTVYTITSPTLNQWYTINVVETPPSDATGNFRLVITQNYADAATANGKVIEVQEVMCVDMGKDMSNPFYNKTTAEMNRIFPTWIK